MIRWLLSFLIPSSLILLMIFLYNRRFNRIDSLFDSIDSSLDRIDCQLTKIEDGLRIHNPLGR